MSAVGPGGGRVGPGGALVGPTGGGVGSFPFPREVPVLASLTGQFTRAVPVSASLASPISRSVPVSAPLRAAPVRNVPLVAYLEAPAGTGVDVATIIAATAPLVPSARWLVFADDGSPLGEWPLSHLPAYRAGMDGIETLTVTVPWVYADRDRERLLDTGNRLEVWVTTPETLITRTPPGSVGQWVIGTNAVGAFAGLSRLMWSGTVEDATRTATEAHLTCVSGSRIPAQTLIDAYQGSADPLHLARDVVTLYLPGLVWDSRNPAASGEQVTVDLTDDTAAGVLDKLRDLCGPGWAWWVTATGTVRLFEPDTETADHVLSVGRTAVDPQLQIAGLGRRREVRATYGDGLVAVARTADYRATDPRGERIAARHLTNAGDAERLARLVLEDRQRTRYRGTVTVPRPTYAVDTIEVGDTASVQQDAYVAGGELWVIGQGHIGSSSIATPPGGYGTPLVVVGVERLDTGDVRLELGEPSPRLARTIANLLRDTAAAGRR